MQHLRDISEYWNWLPAFRAIGETSHLPSAAKALHLSPSALSRSLQQLEDRLGQNLFRRANRRLELTPEGERFLASMRDAMRIVHEAGLRVQRKQLGGTVHVDSSGVASSAWVLPALLELRELHPEFTPVLQSNRTDTLQSLLLKGQLDISFGSIRLNHPQLRTEKVGVVHAGLYCGPPHNLYKKRKVTLDDVRACDFVAPPLDENGLPIDGWPDEIERRVVVQVDRMRHGCEACMESPLLGVFPDLFAERIGRGELRRIALDIIPTTPVFATLRPPIDEVTAAELILDAVRARVGLA